MRIFVTGASGWIGTAVTAELLTHGYDVVGLARSTDAADRLRARGITPHRGDLDDPASLAAAAAEADGVVHLAFKHDFDDYAGAGRSEHAAVRAMLTALEGTDRPFLLASGLVGGGVPGGLLTEADASPHHGPDSLRGGSENLALEHADRGVRPIALRFAPTVHAVGDHGFTAALTRIAKESARAAYIGDGTTRWAAVHRDDAARLVRLALEQAAPGARVHAVGEEGIASSAIAAAIGERLGVPVVGIAPEEADAHFGWLARFFGSDVAASSAATRSALGWTPTGPGLLEDIAAGAYVAAETGAGADPGVSPAS